MKVSILVLGAMLALGFQASAQSQSCYNDNADIDRSLDGDISAAQSIQYTGRDLANNGRQLQNIADQLVTAQQTVDLESSVNGPLGSYQQNVLHARQAMYNVRSLLGDIIRNKDNAQMVEAIVHNIIDNNLTGAENNNDAAYSGIDSLKRSVSQINQQLKSQGNNQNLARQISQNAQNISYVAGQQDRSTSQLVYDLGNMKRRVDDLARTCSMR